MMDILYIKSKKSFFKWLDDRMIEYSKTYNIIEKAKKDILLQTNKKFLPKKYRNKKQFSKLLQRLDEIERDCLILIRNIELLNRNYHKDLKYLKIMAQDLCDNHNEYMDKWNKIMKIIENIYKFIDSE